nr:pectinesterase inhibitor 10-like [Arachis hypogaea]
MGCCPVSSSLISADAIARIPTVRYSTSGSSSLGRSRTLFSLSSSHSLNCINSSPSAAIPSPPTTAPPSPPNPSAFLSSSLTPSSHSPLCSPPPPARLCCSAAVRPSSLPVILSAVTTF